METGRFRNSLRINLFIDKDLLILFLINIIYSLLILIGSDLDWPLYRDANNYANMAKGLEADSPYKYRIPVPAFVGLFPDSYHKWVFLTVTVLSLAFSDILLFRYLRSSGYKRISCYFGSFVWMGSWGYFYHLHNFGLVDPVYLACLILLFNFLKAEKYFSALISLLIGFFIKEAMLFIIPIVILAALFRRKRGFVILNILISIILVIIIRTNFSYYDRSLTSFIIMKFADNAIYYLEEGLLITIVKFTYVNALIHPISIYGIILFTAVIGFFKTDIENKLMFVLLCLAVLVMDLIAADWDRLMFALFPILIMLGIKPINELAEANVFDDKRILLIFGILLLIWVILIPTNLVPIDWYFIKLKHTTQIFFSIGVVVASLYLLIMKKITKFGIKDIMMKELLADM